MQESVLSRLAPPLSSEMKAYVERHRGALRTRLAEDEGRDFRNGAERSDGLALGIANAKLLDGLVSALHSAASAALRPRFPIAIVAVGSYGRGAVAYGSDADVRFIVSPSASEAEAAAFAEALLYPMWDAGVAVGHQVIGATELLALAQTDLATKTTLLDVRTLASSADLVTDLVRRAFDGPFGQGGLPTFVDALTEEARARHERFGGSLFLLEPEVKNGAGGLRDLDGARWAARARFRTGADPRKPGAVWSELVQAGVLVPREAEAIAHAEEFFWRLRNRLHADAGRKSDRLTFEAQERLGVELGYAESKDDAARVAGAERLMQDYYQHARTVVRSHEQILARAIPPRRRRQPSIRDLGRGLHVFDGQVSLDPGALETDPALALRVYLASVREGLPLLPFAREAIARACGDPSFCSQLRESAEANAAFLDLIQVVPDVPTRTGSMVAELHDVGLLLAMIPEFSPVTGRVHHDIYHVYTVDVHSVAAVDRLRALRRGDYAAVHPIVSRLAAEVARPLPLFLATLLHDVGKGFPDAAGSRRNHSAVGAELCDAILPRLGVGSDDAADIRQLILTHLAMYHAATRRDLDDEATLKDFCSLVRGREGLASLYVLTVVDLATTSPTALSEWKARMLDELYLAASRYLDRGGVAGPDGDRTARLREEALGAAPEGERAFLESFLRDMPERYLAAGSAASAVAHSRIARARGTSAFSCDFVPSRHPEAAELCIVAQDQRGLLARLAAAITASRLEVLAAQVYSRPNEAVDVFFVRDRAEGAVGAHRALARLRSELSRVLVEGVDPEVVVDARGQSTSKWRERPSPQVAIEVVLDDRASPGHTVVEIFGKDRPGLLFAIAKAMSDLDLHIALSKINTEGNRVADVFYVTESDGSKVASGERFKRIRDVLLAVVSEGSA